jgi:O-antigen ligase
MFALFVTVLVISLLAADTRSRRILVLAALIAAVATTALVVVIAWDESARRFSGGRTDIIANTAEVIADHPILGVGLGGEQRATREIGRESGRSRAPSHTTPLTITAELGILGAAAYLLFLWATTLALFRLGAVDRSLAFALGATLLVILIHSLSYSGFFEDPLMWGALGLAAAGLAAVPRGATAPG